MANKTFLEFKGFKEAVSRLKKLDGDVKSITEKALKETHSIITKKAENTIQPHHRTGRTEKSLHRDGKVDWNINQASVNVGFNIRQGGLASIFLMYGTPRIKKDQALYDAFWSTKTKNEVLKAQEEIFYNEIARRMSN